jgi:hypothetical protein
METEKVESNDTEILTTWTLSKTLGISVFIIVVGNILIPLLMILLHALWSTFELHHGELSLLVIQKFIGEALKNTSLIFETLIVADVASVFMILFFTAKINRENMKAYLGFNPVKLLPFIMWQVVMAAFFYGTSYLISQASIGEPEFMKQMREILKTQSFGGLILMLMAIVVVAPIFEEMLFRGFMYTGIIKSRPGIFGTILITSTIWSMIHLQYEWIWIAMIFFMGIIFSLARHTTGSIYTVIAMHAVNNLLSFIDAIP